MSEKDGASPVDRYDLKQKIRARDIKINQLERLLEEAKVKTHHDFDWAGQAWDLRQEIEARGKIIESLRKELPELVKANADDFLAEKCNRLESECEELQKQNELLREAAQAEDAGPDSKPELRMKVALLTEELGKCEKKMMTSSLLKKMDDLQNLAYDAPRKRGSRELYKDILERERESYQWCRDNETRLQKEICSLEKENAELKEKIKGLEESAQENYLDMGRCEREIDALKDDVRISQDELCMSQRMIRDLEKRNAELKEPLKLGVKDKHGVEMKEGDILKMPDGKHQVLSWGTEEKVFYGIGNTVTVVSAGFRIAFDGDFKASDCEIAGQSKIKMHRDEI